VGPCFCNPVLGLVRRRTYKGGGVNLLRQEVRVMRMGRLRITQKSFVIFSVRAGFLVWLKPYSYEAEGPYIGNSNKGKDKKSGKETIET
jgi:hypothetical protein